MCRYASQATQKWYDVYFESSSIQKIAILWLLEYLDTVNGFIFVGTNFCRLNRKGISFGIKIRGFYIFIHKSNRKLLFRWYWNSWIGPSTKTTKIDTPWKLCLSQYIEPSNELKTVPNKYQAIYSKYILGLRPGTCCLPPPWNEAKPLHM